MASDLVAFSKFWQYSVGPNSERLKSLKKQSWCPKATNSQRFVAPALLGLQWSVWSLEVSFVAIWGSLWYSFCKYLCKYLYIPVLMYTDFSRLFTIENSRVTQVVNVLMNVWMNLSLLARLKWFNDSVANTSHDNRTLRPTRFLGCLPLQPCIIPDVDTCHLANIGKPWQTNQLELGRGTKET